MWASACPENAKAVAIKRDDATIFRQLFGPFRKPSFAQFIISHSYACTEYACTDSKESLHTSEISRQSSRENRNVGNISEPVCLSNLVGFGDEPTSQKRQESGHFMTLTVLCPDGVCAISTATDAGTCDIRPPANSAIPRVWRMTTAFACDEKSPSRCFTQRCEIRHQRALVKARRRVITPRCEPIG